MTREQIRERIIELGIIPAIRVSSAEDAYFAADAIWAGGIPILEITMTVPGAPEVIKELTRRKPDLLVGAGTVLDIGTAAHCVESGASFLTSPGLDIELVRFSDKVNVPILPGAMTPSEVMTAWREGADLIKVFPCAVLGGPAYIRALKSPFPNIPLVAAGGVSQLNTAEFIFAGASAVGIGRDLIQPRAIARHESGWIRELSCRYLKMVGDARKTQQSLHSGGLAAALGQEPRGE